MPLTHTIRSIVANLAPLCKRWSKSSAPLERYAAKTRAIQLSETINLTRYSATTPVSVAAAFVPFFWETPYRTYVIVLFILVAIPTTSAALLAHFSGRWLRTVRAVDIGHLAAGAFAFLHGLAWATMPIALFAGSDASHRLIVVGTTIGVLADVYVLGPMFPVCLLFAMPLVAGGFFGLMRSGETIAMFLSVLLGVYAVFIVLSCRLLTNLSVQRIVDRLKVEEQNDTIGLLLRDFQENTSDWLWETDAAGRLQHVSERVAQAADLPIAHLKGAPFEMIFRNQNRPAPLTDSAKAIFAAIEVRAAFHDRLIEIRTSPTVVWWRLTGKPIHDETGKFLGYRGVGSDVTVARSAEARVAFMANHDALTGLTNRAAFLDRATGSFAQAVREGRKAALFYLDLDGFKSVNDRFGHSVGDRLLRLVAVRVIATLDADALISRLGGDEFAVLDRVIDKETAARRAKDLITSLSEPYVLDDLTIDIGVSIGIAFAPEDSEDPESLLGKADLALYRAKAEGRGRYRLFVKDYELSVHRRRELEEDLKLALARREFELYYQPLADLSRGKVVCFEALIRWQSPKRGLVSPADFIPVAESMGMVVPLGRWCLVKACHEAAGWSDGIRVAVNISAHHFRNADFVQDVVVALEVSGLDPSRLEIEITESVFLDNSHAAIDNLRLLRERGICIALDDFGTGYSSLNYLINFPVDKLKIDQSFVKGFVNRQENRAIIDAILALAKELSIGVTAEGVETLEQALALQRRGCELVQGYLFSRPQPSSAIEAMIAQVATTLETIVPLRPAPVPSRRHYA